MVCRNIHMLVLILGIGPLKPFVTQSGVKFIKRTNRESVSVLTFVLCSAAVNSYVLFGITCQLHSSARTNTLARTLPSYMFTLIFLIIYILAFDLFSPYKWKNNLDVKNCDQKPSLCFKAQLEKVETGARSPLCSITFSLNKRLGNVDTFWMCRCWLIYNTVWAFFHVFCHAFFEICAVIRLLLECIFKYHSDVQLKCLLSMTLNCLGGVSRSSSCRVLTPTWMWNSSWFQRTYPDWLPQFGSFNNCQQNSPIKQLSSLCSNWDNNPPQLNPFQNVLDVQLQTCCAQTKLCLFQPLWRSLLGLKWERPVPKQQPALCCIKLSLLLLVAKYFTP